MSFLKDSSIVFVSDKKYDAIYKSLSTMEDSYKKVDYKYLFLLSVTIGFKNSIRVPVENKGREIRASYYTQNEESLLINMLMADPDINHDIEWLMDSENFGEIRKIINEYANAGMEIICNRGLDDYWDGENLVKNDSTIIFELSKCVLSEISNVPF